ncbi:MAG: hypothetical protein AABZ00_02765 [Chloroflexota bacterium]
MTSNSVPLEENDVVFRHIAIPMAQSEINGICLSYEKEEDALSLFAAIREYLEARGDDPRRIMSVTFSKQSKDSYSLTIDFAVGEKNRHIYIDGIEKNYVDRIALSLEKCQFYLLVAGYNSRSGLKLLPIEDNHLLRNSLVVDSRIISGHDEDKKDWKNLFGGRLVYIELIDNN